MDYLIEFLIDSYSLMTCTAVCMDACTSMGLRVLPWPRYHATHPPWTLLNRVLGFFPPPISLSFSSSSHHFLRSARRHEGCSSTEAEGRLFTGDAPPSCAADAARSSSAVISARSGDERGHLALTFGRPSSHFVACTKLTSFYRSSSGESGA